MSQETMPLPSDRTMVLFTLGTGIVIGAAVLIARSRSNQRLHDPDEEDLNYPKGCSSCKHGYTIKGRTH